MQKIFWILSFSILLSACNKPATETPATTEPSTDSQQVQQVEDASDQIAAAFTSGASLKCDVTKENYANSQYMIKNKKMKMMTLATDDQSEQYYSINDGEYIYVWTSDESKPGIKMSLAEMQQAAESFENPYQEFPDLSDQSVRDEIEETGYRIDCAPAQINDSEFVPPSNITFSNPMEMFQGMMEQMPTNVPVPSGMTLPQQ